MTVCAQCTDKGGRRGHVRGKYFCSSVHMKLFWHVIYCAKSRPNPKSRSVYRFCRGLGRRALNIMQEDDLVTMIAIQPLTQLRTLKMSFSSFSTMSQFKFESISRDSFLIMPSTERKNGEKFCC